MYRVAIGGPITINSFLTEHDRNTAREHMLKTASTQMREAAKIGLQSLYADPSEVLEKYKDFDIVKEMKARKDVKVYAGGGSVSSASKRADGIATKGKTRGRFV